MDTRLATFTVGAAKEGHPPHVSTKCASYKSDMSGFPPSSRICFERPINLPNGETLHGNSPVQRRVYANAQDFGRFFH
jgi:hypothetical protein